MVAWLVASYFVIKKGKRDAARGESVIRDNLEWHASMGTNKLGGKTVDEVLGPRKPN